MARSRADAPVKSRARSRQANPRARPSALLRETEEAFAPIPEEAVGQLVPTLGYYPAPEGPAVNTLGMIRTFAGMLQVFGTSRADGRLLPVKSNEPLFTLLGGRFGGDGATTFALPDLRGRRTIGGPPAAPGGGPAAEGLSPVPLTHMIAVDAPFPYPYPATPILGSIGLFAGNVAPAGWLPAEGQLLETAKYPDLARLLGSTFGGDGRTGFALPDLRGRSVIGAGAGADRYRQSIHAGLGEVVRGAGGVTALGLNYIICLNGRFPDLEGDGAFPPGEAVTCEVVPYAGDAIPEGWALADGRRLRINQEMALFSILGTTYGGDGWEYLVLPDLTGRIIVGASG